MTTWGDGRLANCGFLAGLLRASKDSPIDPVAYARACLTKPVACLVHRFPGSFYWILLANTVTYAVTGLGVSALGQRLARTLAFAKRGTLFR